MNPPAQEPDPTWLLYLLCVAVQVVSAWKESSKLKDHKIEELNFQLGQAVTQLELARADAAALQQQLVDTRGEVSSNAAALAAVQARAAAQLQALESQLASKESGLGAAEVRRQALEAELNSANSKVSEARLQLSC
jgi:chromosome segregation ATPase